MKIKTKNFILRPPKQEDVDDLWKAFNEKEVAKSMVSVENEQKFKKDFREGVRKNRNDPKRFIIEVDGIAAGKIKIRFDDSYNKTKAVLSYWIGKDFRGKGVMTNAVKLATQYWFRKFPKLVRIEARARTYNKASARVLEKVGYKLEGILRKNVLKNGKHYDDFLYARVR